MSKMEQFEVIFCSSESTCKNYSAELPRDHHKKMTEMKEQWIQEWKLSYGAQKYAGWLLHAI